MTTMRIYRASDLNHFLTVHCPPELPIETRSESGDTREVLTAKIENRRLVLTVGGPSKGIAELEAEIEALEKENEALRKRLQEIIELAEKEP